MNPKIAECGTTSGYNRHLRLGTPTCGPCRAASNEYAKRWRTQNGNTNQLAYMRAMARLRDRYRRVFDRYYAEEKAAA